MNISEDFSWKRRMLKRMNNPLLPSNIRAIIIGKSNCGKKTLLLNLLLQPKWLDYNHLYVFGNTLHQQEYQIMKKAFDSGLSKQQICNIFRNQKEFEKINVSPLKIIEKYNGHRKSEIKADFFSDCSMIPDPTNLRIDEKNLLILDDCFLGPQNKAEAYYTRGRQNNCDTFYISQSYFRLPRHSIRENSNIIILFPQDAKNLHHIYADHCEGDMTLGEFKQFCRKVWSAAPHQFVTIDLSSEKLGGKYRQNLDTFFSPINTSFFHIKDPQKRDEIVSDYLGTVKRVEDIGNECAKDLQQKSIENDDKDDILWCNIPDAKIDKYFGIFKRSDGKHQMGNADVEIENNYIVVAGVHYLRTIGLCELIMLRIPVNYKDEDFNRYRQLVQHTDVMNHPNKLNSNSRPKSTYKWRKIFSKFCIGEGIQFLPGDIKGLQTKLHYLLAEYRAGNTYATRNQIVAVTDELLRRKQLSRTDYDNINNFIQA